MRGADVTDLRLVIFAALPKAIKQALWRPYGDAVAAWALVTFVSQIPPIPQVVWSKLFHPRILSALSDALSGDSGEPVDRRRRV
jgi:hypothetical protein